MAPPILFGIEWELAIGTDGRHPPIADGKVAYFALRDAICKELPWLPDLESAVGVFTPAFRFYCDCGHPEVATVEAVEPMQLVELKRRIFEVLGRAACQAAKVVPGFLLLANNHNHVDAAAYWGCHESYSLRRHPDDLAQGMVPFLASRPLIAGSGEIDRRGRVLASPRVSAMRNVIGGGTTSERALYSTCRDQPLMKCGTFRHRLHLICGDSLRSPFSEYLKVASTALVLLWLQDDPNAADDLKIRYPLRLLRAANVLWQPAGELHISHQALALQEQYCRRVAQFVDSRPALPDWCAAAVAHWAEVLEALRHDPFALADRLDLFIKLWLFDAALENLGRSWKDIAEDEDLFRELALLDLAYQRLGGQGPYESLCAQGRVNTDSGKTVDSSTAINEFVLALQTRAAPRARAIIDLCGKKNCGCTWIGVHRMHPRGWLDLADPLATAGQWHAEVQPHSPE